MESKPHVCQFIVGREDARKRIDHLLISHCQEISRSGLKRLIEEGHVTCNGGAVSKAGHVVKAGDRIRLVIPPPQLTELVPEAVSLDVVYEDDDLLVINKPSGMVVHPGAGRRDGTLVHALLAHSPLSSIGGKFRPGIVHRLDKDTSGLMVVAKHDRAHRLLSEAIKNHEVLKEYLALCYGVPHPSAATIDTLHGRHPVNRLKYTTKVARGKRAITHYQVVKSWEVMSLVRLRLQTGRTHQIRVHLSEKGWPIVGDSLYGKSRNVAGMDRYPGLREVIDGFASHALHSCRLSFIHPMKGKKLEFESRPPNFFDQVEEFFRHAGA